LQLPVYVYIQQYIVKSLAQVRIIESLYVMDFRWISHQYRIGSVGEKARAGDR